MTAVILDPPCVPMQARLDRQDAAFVIVVLSAVAFTLAFWSLTCLTYQHSAE
ncbi:hypothetical protein F5Y05DRAFT_369940 [Hypoxylon sp. FL0543]|nr:hypothetical protein F5Y05DRAFT_369940 [Hypoxylon sp. FL0543]